MQNNQDHLRFRRRAIPTPGEAQPKNRFGVILTVATAAVILPAMVYGIMHPTEVRSTVKQLAHHMPIQVKDLRVAIVATRATPEAKPSPTTTPAPTSTPSAHSQQLAASSSAHAAHLRRLHALELAAAHAKKLASTEQTTSDVASTTATTQPAQTSTDTVALQPAGATQTTATSAPTPQTVAAAQVPDADATPVYAPDVVVDARFTHQVPPDYPAIAKDQGVQGTAVVFATIGPDGKVLSAHIDQSSGNKMLDDAALEAARESGFEPPIIDGKPATETYRLVYTFTL
ncbi:MAG TPA: energy transducer TonB [Candidatus Acidoferrales bacterium]|nr:energy transducer TonB [Candidatus Acidoferrales bacterium]